MQYLLSVSILFLTFGCVSTSVRAPSRPASRSQCRRRQMKFSRILFLLSIVELLVAATPRNAKANDTMAKCQLAVTKAGRALLANRLDRLGKCTLGVLECVQ